MNTPSSGLNSNVDKSLLSSVATNLGEGLSEFKVVEKVMHSSQIFIFFKNVEIRNHLFPEGTWHYKKNVQQDEFTQH